MRTERFNTNTCIVTPLLFTHDLLMVIYQKKTVCVKGANVAKFFNFDIIIQLNSLKKNTFLISSDSVNAAKLIILLTFVSSSLQ